MKVLHFSKYYAKGGASKAALESVIGQRDAGIDAYLCVGRNAGQHHDWLLEPSFFGNILAFGNFVAERLPAIVSGVSHGDQRSVGVSGIDGPELARRIGADICVLHNIDGLLSIESISRFSCPVIWRVHDMWAMCGTEHYTDDTGPYSRFGNQVAPDRISAWTFRRKVKCFSRPASFTICPPSHWLAKEFESSRLFHDRKLTVVPNGVDTSVFDPRDRRDARSRLGLDPEIPLVVFGAATGTRDPRKGFDLLLQSLRDYSADFREQNIAIAIFGGGSIPDLGLRVHGFGTIGDRSTLSDLYSAASVVVVPSRMENLSLTVLEAMSCGTPVIAFNVGGMPDMIVPERTGWLVEPFDTDALAACILKGTRLSERDLNMRAECRRIVLDQFSRSVEASSMKKLFNDVLIA